VSQIGGSTILQDGIEMPLPLARAEGQKLWPHKEKADLILSVGCGVMTPAINMQTDCFSRLIRYFSSSTDSSQRFLKDKLAEMGEIDRCYRIDPHLQMREISLDDTSVIPMMKERLERDLSQSNRDPGIFGDLAWKMVASLFWFQFVETPRAIQDYRGPTCDTEFLCHGEVACRYGDNPNVVKMLRERHPHMRVYIGGKSFAIDENYRTRVSFDQNSWCAPFDIMVESHGKFATITGFPNTIENLLYQQHMGNLARPCTSPEPEPCQRLGKRKLQEGDRLEIPRFKKRRHSTSNSPKIRKEYLLRNRNHKRLLTYKRQ
jgi:hypothetical protein